MLILALLLSQAEPPASVDEAEPDILVFGQRLERLRFRARVDRRGRVRCRVTRSSGDAAFDAVACEAVRDCAARRLESRPAVEACMNAQLRARFDALE